MDSKFFSSISFYKAAPVLSSIMLVSTIIGLDSPSIVGKLTSSAISIASLVAFFVCAKHNS
ncbi:MAG: hypothetical protein ACOZCL_17705 [Bacillota bacterium]